MAAPKIKNAEDDAGETKKACVFCNGEMKNAEHARLVCREATMIIAADGGARHLTAIGLKPHLIIGDMDSLPANMPWSREEVERITFSPEKDKSDAELAVDYALNCGYERVILLCAFGGRIDHTLCNIELVAEHPGRLAIDDGENRIEAIKSPCEIILRGSEGDLVSLIPYGSATTAVTAIGLKCPLNDEPIRYATHGLSNELAGEEARIKVGGGTLLVCYGSEAGGVS